MRLVQHLLPPLTLAAKRSALQAASQHLLSKGKLAHQPCMGAANGLGCDTSHS